MDLFSRSLVLASCSRLGVSLGITFAKLALTRPELPVWELRRDPGDLDFTTLLGVTFCTFCLSATADLTLEAVFPLTIGDR